MYEVIILGAGPAGVAAGVYAARKKIKTLLITYDFGGQSVVSRDIQNWIGERSISGINLARKLEEHLRAQREVEIKTGEKILAVKNKNGGLTVTTDKQEYETKTLIVALGARRRKLNVPGERQFNGKGVVYCSTCDAPLFKNKKVAVVGTGNAGLEAARDLLPYASEIYLIDRGDKITGDVATFEQIRQSEKFKGMISGVEVSEILGEQFVNALKYKEIKSGLEKVLAVAGVFVAIGAVPNTEILRNLVKKNGLGEIVIDHRTMATSHPLIFAAGDVTDAAYKQNNISAGDGVKAALSVYEYLKNVDKH